MRRQFLRVYLGIALVLLLAAFTTLFVVDREVRKVIDQRVEDDMASWIARLRARLGNAADAEQRTRLLERLNEFAPFAIRLVPRAGLELSDEAAIRLAAGEPVLVETDEGRVVYGTLDDAQAIALGPLQRHMLGPRGRRGLAPPLRPLEEGLPRFESALPPQEEGPPRFLRFPFQDTYFLLGILLAILLLIGAAVYLLLRPFERRIYALADVARRFGEGQLEVRAPAGRDDAIGALALAFNHMAGRIGNLIAQQQELLRAVSHELRTPLARLFFLVDDAQGAPDPEGKDQYLRRIENSLQDLDALVGELLTFVRLEGGAEPPASEIVALGPVLAEVAGVVRDLRPGLEVEVDPADLEVPGAPRLLRRAVLNLATNAARHARQRVRLACAREGAAVQVVVDDDGPGVPAGARARIFEPFYRLDESRTADAGGAGLGLAIVQRIMELHGGQASVGDSPLGGARFALMFPAAPPPAA